MWSSPAVADGKVYVGSNDTKVYALNALTGALVWNYTTGAEVISSPAVADGKVYVGSYDDKIYCLNAATGALVWSYTADDYFFSSPAVADGKVYIGSYDRQGLLSGCCYRRVNMELHKWLAFLFFSCCCQRRRLHRLSRPQESTLSVLCLQFQRA